MTLRTVNLSFGPDNQAKLTLELMIPPGKGPFPVFLTQWNHREWAQVAVRRGYLGCIYSGSDDNDETEKYSEIWAGKYDFTQLMRRAFGASRAIDYLYTLDIIDKDKIGLTGHSRNGKTSLEAAAFDERIKAVVPISGGTGCEVPWRYCSPKYDVEDLALLTCNRPGWFLPRLRFFTGRENKLPVDQNLFMALIAPRGLMLTTALSETASNVWGMEQAYHSAKKVYEFLGAPDNIAIKSRNGLHSLSARDMEETIDFFDYVFKRNNRRPENMLYCTYSFDSWRQLSGENINPIEYPVEKPDNLLFDDNNKKITSVADWKVKKDDIKKTLVWVLGDEPAGVTNPGPGHFSRNVEDENKFGTFLDRPKATASMGVMPVSPYNGFGDQLYGYLYYPGDEKGNLKSNKLPVVIYLHEWDYSKGFSSVHKVQALFESIVNCGYAVFSYDMIGFGNRMEEGTRFYNRYPHWSKMGKMVTDVKGALDALNNLDFIDGTKIYIMGYSLGATVGLYTAALDERVSGVVSVCGFTPMRADTPDKGTEGIKAYSHLHGVLPRLGFFAGNEAHIPYDFGEILACIAPRPIFVIAPQMDKDASLTDIKYCIQQVKEIYQLMGDSTSVGIFSPDDYNRFSDEMRQKTYEWLIDRLKKPAQFGLKTNN